MRVLFVEPPKDFWFVIGEYLPPPYGILKFAAFLEQKNEDAEIQVLDCNAEGLDWNGLEKRIESYNPDVVASSGLATCNTYLSVGTLELAKKVNPEIVTVAEGQHFTVMVEESLKTCPEIDVILRGEEETLVDLTKKISEGQLVSSVKDVSFRNNGQIIHNSLRPDRANYDMVHGIMPTEYLSVKEVQEELYNCNKSFFGSWRRRIGGIFSRKALKRRLYWYMASQGIVNQVKTLF